MTPEIIARAKAYRLARGAMYDANRRLADAEQKGLTERTVRIRRTKARNCDDLCKSRANMLAEEVLRELDLRGYL